MLRTHPRRRLDVIWSWRRSPIRACKTIYILSNPLSWKLLLSKHWLATQAYRKESLSHRSYLHGQYTLLGSRRDWECAFSFGSSYEHFSVPRARKPVLLEWATRIVAAAYKGPWSLARRQREAGRSSPCSWFEACTTILQRRITVSAQRSVGVRSLG